LLRTLYERAQRPYCVQRRGSDHGGRESNGLITGDHIDRINVGDEEAPPRRGLLYIPEPITNFTLNRRLAVHFTLNRGFADSS
jgi:hypothetical protein